MKDQLCPKCGHRFYEEVGEELKKIAEEDYRYGRTIEEDCATARAEIAKLHAKKINPLYSMLDEPCTQVLGMSGIECGLPRYANIHKAGPGTHKFQGPNHPEGTHA